MNQVAVLAFITIASIGVIAVGAIAGGACLGALQDINKLRKEVYKAHAEAGKWKALYEKQKASHTLDEEYLSLAEKLDILRAKTDAYIKAYEKGETQ